VAFWTAVLNSLSLIVRAYQLVQEGHKFHFMGAVVTACARLSPRAVLAAVASTVVSGGFIARLGALWGVALVGAVGVPVMSPAGRPVRTFRRLGAQLAAAKCMHDAPR
jgi:hypothetical protein